MELFDTHFHLPDEGDTADYLQQLLPEHNYRMLTLGGSLAGSVRALEFARRHANVWAACGVHPHDAGEFDGNITPFEEMLADQKIRATQELTEIVSRYYTPTEREVYISRLSDVLSLPVDVLRNNVDIVIRRRYKEQKAQETRTAQESIRNYGDRVNPDAAKFVQAHAAESLILGMMLLYAEFRTDSVLASVSLTAGDFKTEFHRRVFEAILALEHSPDGFSSSMLGEYFTPEEIGRITLLEQKRRELTVNDISVFRDGVLSLKKEGSRLADREEDDLASMIRRRREEAEKKRKGDA